MKTTNRLSMQIATSGITIRTQSLIPPAMLDSLLVTTLNILHI
ncbi:MAG: hypothetical protein WA816_02735 [Bacteroidales bacterium]